MNLEATNEKNGSSVALEISPEEKIELWEEFTEELKGRKMTASELDLIDYDQLSNKEFDVLSGRCELEAPKIEEIQENNRLEFESYRINKNDELIKYAEPYQSRYHFYALMKDYLLDKIYVKQLEERQKKGKMAA